MNGLLFIGTPADTSYLAYLKSISAGVPILVSTAPVDSMYAIKHVVQKRKLDGVLTTSPALLKKLVGIDKLSLSEASIANYAGSYFLHDGIEYVILDPLAQLITVPYARFITRRYITKLSAPQNWMKVSAFNYSILNATNIDSFYSQFDTARLISVDIETAQNPLRITCIGYTAIFSDGNSKSVVLPIDSEWAIAWMRKFNLTKPPKIFQNGKYDNMYLSSWNAPIYNWMYDTANLFHSWYSELPKDLGFLNSFFVRTAAYWKDLAKTSDLETYYKYNALDTWATANCALAAISEMPQWAINNYLNEFPLNFPCHLSEMIGIDRDMEALSVRAKEQEKIISENNASLDKMLGVKNFNVASPKQKKDLFRVLGCADIAATSTDEKSLKKVAFRHPLNARIVSAIIKVQKARKLKSTYLVEGKEYNGKILYSLNPHGTDTTRLASKESAFWCGLQAQNIPRGKIVKSTLVAPAGWRIAECDLEQAESRDTANIAGDEKLIAAVSGEADFHSTNASAFFGIPYDEIYSDEKRKTINSDLRDLAKKVNHGANYCMGPAVLVQTMGEENIYKAAVLLKLPRGWSAKQIAEHLLAQFHKTYPFLSRVYYPAVIHEIVTTKMLVIKSRHHCDYQAAPDHGLVRYCFSDPSKDKRAMNAYVAHSPQALNAQTLNRAFMTIFYEIALHPVHSKNFKLLAQIHDSCLFLFREGHEYLAEEVKKRMEIPVSVIGADRKERTFIVPAAIKAGADGKGAQRWSDI